VLSAGAVPVVEDLRVLEKRVAPHHVLKRRHVDEEVVAAVDLSCGLRVV
jgi:hypothetical protein